MPARRSARAKGPRAGAVAAGGVPAPGDSAAGDPEDSRPVRAEPERASGGRTPARRPPRRSAPAGTRRPRAQRDFRDEVVLERTGRCRSDWYAILDAFGPAAHGHKAAAAHLMDVHGAPSWWAQMITVEYERARGIRSPGTRSDGYACTVQRALAVEAARAWQAFEDPAEVARWTASGHRHRFRERGGWTDARGGRGRFEQIVPGRFFRFSWDHPTRAPHSTVEVQVVARGPGRSTIRLAHRGIRSAEEREDLRTHWSWVLDSLKSFVETGAPIPHDAWVASR